jgi:hypothetical protein
VLRGPDHAGSDLSDDGADGLQPLHDRRLRGLRRDDRLHGLDGRGKDRLLRLSGQRVGPELELRQQHGLALPERQRLLA